ncbi:MAG: hypothetical protein J2P25_23635 [Nocardiopsaceae bacterium]|nr:hypothetical protein [Nocardiopsaceae bacterium]
MTVFGDKYAEDYSENLVVIDPDGAIHDLGSTEDGIIDPAADGTLFIGRWNRIRRCRIVRR